MKQEKTTSESSKKLVCGIIMPISSIDGCSASHWADVLEILTEAIEDAGFGANLVSNAEEVGIIHKRIIQNLYDNPIVVCDVSGRNPNVMFELGLRLAFDKPTIIVKDDKTSYSFDTSAIEHLDYPRDLRFSKIVDFKHKLSEKIEATHKKSTSDSAYTTFLKHFGEFTVAKLDKKEVSGQEYILEELRSVRAAMARLERTQSFRDGDSNRNLAQRQSTRPDINVCLEGKSDLEISQVMSTASKSVAVAEMWVEQRRDHKHLFAKLHPCSDAARREIESLLGAKRRPRQPVTESIQDQQAKIQNGGDSA